VLDVAVDFALHHCAAVVIFNVTLPSALRHRGALGEALFSEVFDGIIVSVCEKVMQVDLLCVILQTIHESRAIPFDLLGSCDCKEHDFGKFLGVKGPEDAATKDHWPLILLLFNNDHCLVDPVHD
jgi:hypothetical protein